jgi:hypothetical protein
MGPFSCSGVQHVDLEPLPRRLAAADPTAALLQRRLCGARHTRSSVPLELDGPWAKVDRAAEHLNALDFGCRLFLTTKPYYVVADFDPEAKHHVVRLRIRQQVPLALSVVVGELVHSLRSALDQAVWLIACRSNPVEKLWREEIARQISFPVTDDPDKFRSHTVTRYIADDAKTVLDTAQPYRGTDRARALADVDRLWNIDKHRILLGGIGAISLANVSFVPRAIVVDQLADVRVENVLRSDVPAKDGTEIAYVYFGPLPENTDPSEYPSAVATGVEVRGEPTAQVLFGATGGGAAFSTEGLARLIDHTAETLSEISALPEHSPN